MAATAVFGNALLLPLIVNHLPHGSDVARLLQLNWQIRRMALATLRYNDLKVICFAQMRVTNKDILQRFQIPLWSSLELLDLRECIHINSAIFGPLCFFSLLQTLLLAGCSQVKASVLLGVLKSMLKLIRQDKKVRSDFAPLKTLSIRGISGLDPTISLRWDHHYRNSNSYPESIVTNDLRRKAFELDIATFVASSIDPFGFSPIEMRSARSEVNGEVVGA